MTITWDNGSPGGHHDPQAGPVVEDLPRRPLARALLLGTLCRCPACGAGRLFERYLAVAPACGTCGEALHHQRADDAPPYFSTFLVGHVVVALVLSVELAFAPPLWLHLAVWLPLTLLLVLLSLPPIKGALVAQQWALYMHGFGEAAAAKAAREGRDG